MTSPNPQEGGKEQGFLSAALYAAYQAGEDGLAVLRRFSPISAPPPSIQEQEQPQ